MVVSPQKTLWARVEQGVVFEWVAVEPVSELTVGSAGLDGFLCTGYHT